MEPSSILNKMKACREAVEWARDYQSLRECWENCERGDWLLWFAAKRRIDRKILVLASCDCAERALKYVPEGEKRPEKAIEVARDWANGVAEVTLGNVRAAAHAASVAYYIANSATYAAAAAAAAAAAHAVSVAYIANSATYAAAAAVADAYDAAEAADAYDAAEAAAAEADIRETELKWSADKVRERISWDMLGAGTPEIEDHWNKYSI